MTTILSVFSAIIFYKDSMHVTLTVTIVVGLIQLYSKLVMRGYFITNKSEGMSSIEAAESVPDGISTVNMFTSLAIYALSGYAVYIYFIK